MITGIQNPTMFVFVNSIYGQFEHNKSTFNSGSFNTFFLFYLTVDQEWRSHNRNHVFSTAANQDATENMRDDATQAQD